MPPRPPRRRALPWLLAGLALVASLALATAAPFLLTPSVEHLARDNPRTTALAERRRAQAGELGLPFRPRMSWVPLDRIAPRLAEAVVLSEDASFWVHHGFDLVEIRAAAADGWSRGRLGRGASTLTQQLAKNLWLGPDRTLWRKAREAALTVKLERALGKKRILALYLNAAEWGEGVFGAEAAARAWFGIPARDLSTAQCALLASMLPSPRRAGLAPTPAWLATRARRLLDRMQAVGRIGAEEHASASAELERILAGPGSGDEEVPEEAEEPALEPGSGPGEPPPPPAPAGPREPSGTDPR